MKTVYIGLGSNIEPIEHMRHAAAALRERWPDITFSQVYRSAPQGYEEQAAFLNAVAKCETEEDVGRLKTALEEIETALGKHIAFRFGPRTIDLDLLLYGDLVLPTSQEWPGNGRRTPKNEHLVIPHPRMHERRFVLEPLCELMDPQERHPVLGKTWEELRRSAEHQDCSLASVQLDQGQNVGRT